MPLYNRTPSQIQNLHQRSGSDLVAIQNAWTLDGSTLRQVFSRGTLYSVEANYFSGQSEWLRAFSLSGERIPSLDINIGDIPNVFFGLALTPTRIYVKRVELTRTVQVFDRSGSVQSSETITLGRGIGNPGLAVYGDRIYALTSESFSVPTAHGVAVSSNRVYVLDDDRNYIRSRTKAGVVMSAEDVDIGAGQWRSLEIFNRHFYVHDSAVNIIKVWDLQGNRISDRDISLGTGNWNGVSIIS